MNKERLVHIEKFCEEYRRAIVRDIARLVAVESVVGESKPHAPFGEGCARALKLGLEIAGELGLDTVNCEDRLGYATVGKGEKYIATVTHLDCVPTGDGWSADPFTLREREGYMIGRGVMDDKGPSVLCLYALKYLKDNSIPLRYEVRALLGISEETGMEDVKYYLENYPAPAFCFSPDADFPIIHGEKGSTHGELLSVCPLERIADIRGGFAVNAVPDKAEAWVKTTGLRAAERVELCEENGITHVTAHGIGGHASAPEGSINAIGVLVNYLLENNAVGAEEEKYLRALSRFHASTDGSSLGVQAQDDIFKPLTLVGGTVEVRDGRIVQTYDSRFPTTTNGRKIAEGIRKCLGDAAEVVMTGEKEPFCMGLDDPTVKLCLDVYNSVTGEDAKPFTIGGGTYARLFPRAFSFGPEHHERPQPDFAGPIHGVDEAANIDWFLEALKIYIAALIELQEIEL